MANFYNRARIDEAKEELHKLLNEDELRNAALLVYANKQDLQGAMRLSELTDKLDLHKEKSRKWFVQACCAVTGEGIYEGLDWLSKAVDA